MHGRIKLYQNTKVLFTQIALLMMGWDLQKLLVLFQFNTQHTPDFMNSHNLFIKSAASVMKSENKGEDVFMS